VSLLRGHFSFAFSEAGTRMSLQTRQLLVSMAMLLLLPPPAGGQAPVIEGRTFENWSAGDTPIVLRAEHSGAVVRNNIFRGGRSVAIVLDGARNVLIEDNGFEGITDTVPDRDVVAIACNEACRDVTIRGNLFVDIGADGFQAGHRGRDIRDIRILDNRFYRTPDFVGGENGIDLKHVQGPVHIAGNLFYGFRPCPPDVTPGCTGDLGNAIVGHMGATGVTIEGNTFVDNAHGVRIFRNETASNPLGFGALAPTGITVRDNHFIGNHGHGLYLEEVIDAEVTGNVFAGNGSDLTLERIPWEGGGCESRGNLFVTAAAARGCGGAQ
jgi:nitrous oxidase accessory protein NosD